MRMNERDFNLLARKARKCGLTKSSYIRMLIHGYEPRETPPVDYFAMTRELKEIGNNMNQLAFIANAIGIIDEVAYHENIIFLRDALRRIEHAVTGETEE